MSLHAFSSAMVWRQAGIQRQDQAPSVPETPEAQKVLQGYNSAAKYCRTLGWAIHVLCVLQIGGGCGLSIHIGRHEAY